MNNSGEYLSKMMKLESLSKQELAILTGKTESTVSSWTRYVDAVIPKFLILVIICHRLGITLEDFFTETVPQNLMIISKNIYKPFLVEDGSIVSWVLSADLLTKKNSGEILSSYINDLVQFKNMLNNALRGKEINQEVFNSLCMNLHIYFQYYENTSLMNFNDIELYKSYLSNVEENGLPEDPIDRCMVIRPYANYLFLLDDVCKEITINYIEALFDYELDNFMSEYITKVEKNNNYDKNNILLKCLFKNHAHILDEDGNKNYDILYSLLNRIY